jgi:hypothetical protein
VDASSGSANADFEAFAREQRAVAELGRRRVALESKVVGIAFGASFGPGLLGLILLREWEHGVGVSSARHGGELGFLVPMLLAVFLGHRVARRMVRTRRDAWLEELALVHEVPS